MDGDNAAAATRRIRLAALSKAENAGELRDEILACKGADLEIDGSDVEFLSGLSVQVLLAAREMWRLDGVDFRIEDPSETLRADLSLFGLPGMLAVQTLEGASA